IQMEVPNKEGKLDTWRPHNANGYFTNDSLSLKAAFAQSVNSIAVKLGNELGISNVARTAKAMGVESPLDATPSLSLGSSDVNLLELINAYCTAVNDGKKHEPVLVTKIVDRKGNVIYTAPTEEVQAIPYRSAFYMQQLLMGGMKERGGTSMALWGYINPYARSTDFGGKTGTSSNHSDAWFVGITPGLVGGAWVGGEYRCIHFRTGALGQGSRTALPIFGYFMQSVLKDPNFKKYKRKFAPCKEDIDPSTYNCPSYVTEKVKVDTLLTDSLATADEEIIDETIKPKVKESDEIKFDEIVGEDNKKKVTP
ncbi:MAG: penicillin-binding transpeptidase domain-containing protein, partial [Bacteroidaceae bacterium]